MSAALNMVDLLALAAFALPFCSFLISFLISDRYGWAVSLAATFTMMLAALASCVALWNGFSGGDHLIGIPWFDLAGNAITANIYVGKTSLLMLFVVSVISFLVHLYSVGYMAADVEIRKYFAMLGFFTFAMNGIVLADNLLVLFAFWELVGFSSYMLIGHYMMASAAAQAAKKAFIMNRIGDAGFIAGLMVVWLNAGTFNLSDLFGPALEESWRTTASLCFFCGVIGKSAQFPLFTWLPDAMEGPTPVSALIHAATMVAAGVYLTIRIFPVFTVSSLQVVAVVGAATSLVGAACALSNYDIKKILAYSTISQLGMMMMALGLGVVDGALLHLYTHAFFKACLFLCAGSVIHALHQAQQQAGSHADIQDIRNMGGLSNKLPVNFFSATIAAASLAGIPLFSGFLSKEAMLAGAWARGDAFALSIFGIMMIVSFMTVVYAMRFIWYVFLRPEAGTFGDVSIIMAPPVMRVPVIVLAAGSVWLSVSWNPFHFEGWVITGSAATAPATLTLFSAAWALAAAVLAYALMRLPESRAVDFFLHGLYLDKLYHSAILTPLERIVSFARAIDSRIIDRMLHLSAFANVTVAHVIAWSDRMIVDGLVHGLARVLRMIGGMARSVQNGKIQGYIFWAVFGIIIFIICTV